MAIRHRAVVATKWFESGNNNLSHFETVVSGAAWFDLTAQQCDPVTGKVKTLPNVYFIGVMCDNATGTAILARTDMRVLIRQTLDDTNPVLVANEFRWWVWEDWEQIPDGSPIFTNPASTAPNNVPTQPQIDTFVSQLKASFPDVLDAHLEDAGQKALELGLTRRQMLVRLIAKMRQYARAA